MLNGGFYIFDAFLSTSSVTGRNAEVIDCNCKFV